MNGDARRSRPRHTYWSVDDAALALHNSLRRIGELEAERQRYNYSYPDRLMSDMRSEGARARDAVRYLMSTEADDAEEADEVARDPRV